MPGSAREATSRTSHEIDFCVFLQVLGRDRGFLVAT